MTEVALYFMANPATASLYFMLLVIVLTVVAMVMMTVIYLAMAWFKFLFGKGGTPHP